ncbi:MAG: deaminase [Candidatus Saccharimonadales bacterium]
MHELTDLIKPLKKLAKTSRARLGGVACFIIQNGAIVSSGINYNPTGEPMEHEVDGTLVSRPGVIHAEVATLSAATKNEVKLTGATMFLTMSPCLKCARAIAATDIKHVAYLYDWWDKAALETLHTAGISTQKITEES